MKQTMEKQLTVPIKLKAGSLESQISGNVK
jgi:hypothetical protein